MRPPGGAACRPFAVEYQIFHCMQCRPHLSQMIGTPTGGTFKPSPRRLCCRWRRLKWYQCGGTLLGDGVRGEMVEWWNTRRRTFLQCTLRHMDYPPVPRAAGIPCTSIQTTLGLSCMLYIFGPSSSLFGGNACWMHLNDRDMGVGIFTLVFLRLILFQVVKLVAVFSSNF
ncbi:hypothetical protein B0H10DRAFT_766554 [Mycena sp. CBHHK59/15]|nr:hypothetical protein B0H10DRAFT_766554 [Mycena sp. CBHHK59/15]